MLHLENGVDLKLTLTLFFCPVTVWLLINQSRCYESADLLGPLDFNPVRSIVSKFLPTATIGANLVRRDYPSDAKLCRFDTDQIILVH
jgi:hypothetical protein